MKLPNKPTLSVAEVAALLGISRNHAFKAIHQGDLPSIRIGRRVLVPTAQLKALLDGHAEEPGSQHVRSTPRARSVG